MKGATTEPWLKTINIPKNANTIIIGKSQYFFLSIKNSTNSFINSPIFYNFKLSYNSLLNKRKQ